VKAPEILNSLGKILQPKRLQDDKSLYIVINTQHIVILNAVKDLVA